MKTYLRAIGLCCALALFATSALAQFQGGSFDGHAASRSDDILYDGTEPVVTGDELPDVVHNLTIDNPGGVTLSKSITVTGKIIVLNGTFDLDGNQIILGPNATVIESPNGSITSSGGTMAASRELDNIADGVNVAGLGLILRSQVSLGRTDISRGHVSQFLTPLKSSTLRFFDVDPSNRTGLDVTVDFIYRDAELQGVPEASLALFKTVDEPVTAGAAKTAGFAAIAQASNQQWQYLGGAVDQTTNRICKGGIDDFSRLTLAPGYVFLAELGVKIDENFYSEGDIHSNGPLVFLRGKPGRHIGDLSAVSDILIKGKNTIEGSVVTGGKLRLFDHPVITGTSSEEPVPSILQPDRVFKAGRKDFSVPKRGSGSLEPGSYGKVEAKDHATLKLFAGDYFIEFLDLDKGSTLILDVTGGPVNINVTDKIEFSKYIEVKVEPHGQAGSSFVSFTTLQHRKLEVERGAFVQGYLFAPNTLIEFSKGSRFRGSAVAKAILVEDNVPFVPHGSATILPKATMPPEEELDLEADQVITEYELQQNYPNPFNAGTLITFALPQAERVSLAIYDVTGRLVKTLVAGDYDAGKHEIFWDGRAEDGAIVASGLYLYRLSAGSFVAQRKLTLMK